MAYDAAASDIVLFGGAGAVSPYRSGYLRDTWTWDGTTWTQQAPATHPSAREQASMAYDAATGQVVLFGGNGHFLDFDGTWTWG